MATFRRLSLVARLYVIAITAAGGLALADSVRRLAFDPPESGWWLLATLTFLSGSIAVTLPAVPATISVSETFVFTSVLLFGTAAGTVTAALDGLVISFWLVRKNEQPFYKAVFSIACVAISLWVAADAFFAIARTGPLTHSTAPVRNLLLPLLVLATLYWLLNTGLVATAVALERKLSFGNFCLFWRKNFTWLSLNYLTGASVAGLLVSYTRHIDLAALSIIVPLLLISYLTYKTAIGRIHDARKHFDKLNSLYLSTIEALAMAIDAKDQITHGHIRRVQLYAIQLARRLGIDDGHEIRAIEAAALLHDMGKLAVPEYILNKPGALTPAEYEKMKLHATVGAEILSSIDFPYPVVPIVRHHHENWDGSGYPDGLKETAIPIGARILSVVDCFDALTSDRPYRPRLSDHEALKILRERRGTMYDPRVVDMFAQVYEEIAQPLSRPLDRTALSAISETSQGRDLAESPSHFEQIRASASETLTLYDLAKSLSAVPTLQEAAEVIAVALRRMLPASVCSLYMLDPNRSELVAAAVSGECSNLLKGHRIPLGQRVSGWVAANLQTIINSDSVLDIGDVARSTSSRLRSCLSTPLIVDNQVSGAVTLHSTATNAFSEDHARIVEAVVQQTARILLDIYKAESRRQHSAMEQLAALPDFVQLQRLFANEQAGTGSTVLASVLVVRVDGLRHAHSWLGAEVIDEIYAGIVLAIRSALRGADILFRRGSDEFVIALPQAGPDASTGVATRVHTSLQHALCRPPFPAGLAEHTMIQLATASSPVDGTQMAALIETARSRLPPAVATNEAAIPSSPFVVH